jgi:RES domain-containing protein
MSWHSNPMVNLRTHCPRRGGTSKLAPIRPSVVARREGNVLINPRHPDFSGIVASAPEPVVWDARLFGRR